MKYILASASPRRKELLEQIGIHAEIIPAQGEENAHGLSPKETVLTLSFQKAKEIANKRMERMGGQEEVIIGADTVVAFGDEILGKPKDAEDAFRMLSLLQGNTHKVYTGVTFLILKNGQYETNRFYEETEVTMYPMDEEELRWYIKTGEPFDKAGGYAIQGKCAVFIKEIHGSYHNVVGLPVAKLYHKLRKKGLEHR